LKIDTSQYLHIVVTRDPVSRWFSSYTEHQRHCSDFFKGHVVPPPMTLLRDIVKWRETGDAKLSTDAKYVHMRPQADYVSPKSLCVPMDALSSPSLLVKALDGTVLLSGPVPKSNEFGITKKGFAHAQELQRMKTGDLRDEAKKLILAAYIEDFPLHERAMKQNSTKTTSILWINLEKHHDRRSHMQSILGSARHTRICALGPSHVQGVKNTPDRDVKETACLCSHLEAMSVFVGEETTDEWVVITEDDITFPFGPSISTSKLEQSAPRDAEVLQLCTVNPYFYSRRSAPLWTRWGPENYGTQAYAIKRSAAERILDIVGIDPSKGTVSEQLASGATLYLDRLPGIAVADDCIYRTCSTYTCSVPIVIGVDAFGSDIHSDHLPLQARSWKAARQASESGDGRKNGVYFCTLA